MKILLIGGNKGLGLNIKTTLMRDADNEVICLHRSGRPTESYVDLTAEYSVIDRYVKGAIKRLDGLDTLIITSGSGAFYKPLQLENNIDKMYSINARGPIFVYRSALRALLKSDGKVCFITSTAARKPGDAGLSLYAGSKAFIHGFVTSESRRLGKHGVAMFAVSPGYFDSDMTENINEAKKKKAVKGIPFGRFGTANEISDFVVGLLKQSNWTLSGSIYECSGGA